MIDFWAMHHYPKRSLQPATFCSELTKSFWLHSEQASYAFLGLHCALQDWPCAPFYNLVTCDTTLFTQQPHKAFFLLTGTPSLFLLPKYSPAPPPWPCSLPHWFTFFRSLSKITSSDRRIPWAEIIHPALLTFCLPSFHYFSCHWNIWNNSRDCYLLYCVLKTQWGQELSISLIQMSPAAATILNRLAGIEWQKVTWEHAKYTLPHITHTHIHIHTHVHLLLWRIVLKFKWNNVYLSDA
jgi:hypothetical protein